MGRFVIDTDALARRCKAELLAGLNAADDPRSYMEEQSAKMKARVEKCKAELVEARASSLRSSNAIDSLYKLIRFSRSLEADDLDGAILGYEQGLEICKAAGLGIGHQRACWERLFVLYRKAGRLLNEEVVLLYSLEVLRSRGSVLFSLIEKSETRLARCRALIKKQSGNG